MSTLSITFCHLHQASCKQKKAKHLQSNIHHTGLTPWTLSLTNSPGNIKKTSIRLSPLQKIKDIGGLAAPKFQILPPCTYHLQYIAKWLQINKQSQHPRLDIEQYKCQELPISDLPFLTQLKKKHNYFKYPFIAVTLTAWWKLDRTPPDPN